MYVYKVVLELFWVIVYCVRLRGLGYQSTKNTLLAPLNTGTATQPSHNESQRIRLLLYVLAK